MIIFQCLIPCGSAINIGDVFAVLGHKSKKLCESDIKS